MAQVRGDPDRLEEYTEATRPTLERTREALDAYRRAIVAFNAAWPNDLGTTLSDRSPEIEATLVELHALDETPAAFGAALRELDASGGVITVDEAAFRRELAKDRGLVDQLVPFLLGDVANFWSGGDDGFPFGSLTASMLRTYRTAKWVPVALEYGSRSPEAMRLFPTFNTGLVGRGLAAAGGRVPIAQVASAAEWLRTPGATTFFGRLNVVGGAVATVSSGFEVFEQGDPAEAYRREGAGYVADVGEFVFSASSTAFFLIPNPYVGAVVVASGVVWAGAEVVDHWNEIVAFGDQVGEVFTDVGVETFEYLQDTQEAIEYVEWWLDR